MFFLVLSLELFMCSHCSSSYGGNGLHNPSLGPLHRLRRILTYLFTVVYLNFPKIISGPSKFCLLPTEIDVNWGYFYLHSHQNDFKKETTTYSYFVELGCVILNIYFRHCDLKRVQVTNPLYKTQVYYVLKSYHLSKLVFLSRHPWRRKTIDFLNNCILL